MSDIPDNGVGETPEVGESLKTVPPPELLTENERFTLKEQLGVDPDDHIGFSLAAQAMQIVQEPDKVAFIAVGALPMGVIEQLKSSGLMDADGNQVIRTDGLFSLHPTIRLVVPWSALSKKAEASLRNHINNPEIWVPQESNQASSK